MGLWCGTYGKIYGDMFSLYLFLSLLFILVGYVVLWHKFYGIYGDLCACGLGPMGFV